MMRETRLETFACCLASNQRAGRWNRWRII